VPPFARQGLPDLAAGNVCPDGGVTSRKPRPAVKLVWPSNNVTMPTLAGYEAMAMIRKGQVQEIGGRDM
ncbi:hypothetical protein, partial [Teichococcus wenyumeiae]|uniref:hypothetical protein n=1 Tax=Teichococcus wenyumeiae TaxID=2478470 RepID=UPI001F1C8062